MFSKKNSDEGLNENELRCKWLNLKDTKKLKFIIKAANKFDADHEDDDEEITKDNCFSSNLTRDELDILIKSYNFPDKFPE